jgi:hypothetical protein
MNTEARSIIWKASTGIEADSLLGALRSAGFHPSIMASFSPGSHTGAEVTLHIEVPTTETSAATEFLKSHDNPTHDA